MSEKVNWTVDAEDNRILGRDMGGKRGREVVCHLAGSCANPEVMAHAQLIARAPDLARRVEELKAALRSVLQSLRDLREELPMKDTAANHHRILEIGEPARRALEDA